MSEKIYALGIGRSTPVFVEWAESVGYEVVGAYHYDDSRTGEFDHGIPILGSFNDLFSKDDLDNQSFILTMGNNEIRASLIAKLLARGAKVPSIIHPLSCVSRFAHISDIAVYIGPFTYIQADTYINQGTIILSHVNISHTTKIGRYCFIAGKASVGAYTEMQDYVFMGQGALSISGKVDMIGEGAVIGAYTLITKSVTPCSVIKGIPGRPITDFS